MIRAAISAESLTAGNLSLNKARPVPTRWRDGNPGFPRHSASPSRGPDAGEGIVRLNLKAAVARRETDRV